AQFDRDYLLVSQLAQGIGEIGLDGGTTVRSDLVRCHREGDRVELWAVTPPFAAAPGTPMARTVAYSFGHSVAWAFPIAAVKDPQESEVLIDLAPFLLSDWPDVGAVVPWSAWPCRGSFFPTGPRSGPCSRTRPSSASLASP